PGLRAVIVAGHNSGLERRAGHDQLLREAVVFGFTDLMPALMMACDVLVANAGGLTCLEAFAARLPVVMFEPLPGHGEDNSRHMERAGIVSRATGPGDLGSMLAAPQFWERTGPATATAARELFDRPSTADCLHELRPVSCPNRALVRARRVFAVAAAVMALGMADRTVDAVAGAHVHQRQAPVVHTWDER
ncbi:MAG: hypothetical protein ABJB93_11270, partial [Gaiellales bacterium]